MSTTSYLPDVAGGMVAAAVFSDDAKAAAAITLLRSAGVRVQDVSVVASDASRASRLAGDQAWTIMKNRKGGLARLMPASLPAELKHRYGAALKARSVVIVAAADGQPPDTLAALLQQAGGDAVERWWQTPCSLFAPPELAGPF